MGLRELTNRIEGHLLAHNVESKDARAYVTGIAINRHRDLDTHRRRPHYMVDVRWDHLLSTAELFLLQNSLAVHLLVARESRGAPPAHTYAHYGQSLFVRAANRHQEWKDLLLNVADDYSSICTGLQSAFNVPRLQMPEDNPLLERTWRGELAVRETERPF